MKQKINPEWERRKGVYCELCRKLMAEGLGKCSQHTLMGVDKYVKL